MNIETIRNFKKFQFFDALIELKNSERLLSEKIQILLNMILAFYPFINENELIEYITFLEINLKNEEIFNLVSYWITTYVGAGGIMVENCNEHSLVLSQNSVTYIEATHNIELRENFKKMHNDICGRDLFE